MFKWEDYMGVRIVGISASHRKDSNNETFVKVALEASKITSDVETVFVSLANKNIKPCNNCRACIKLGKCAVKDDWWESFKVLCDPVPDGVIFSAQYMNNRH
jgi:multimeric flavodoxin WrbA